LFFFNLAQYFFSNDDKHLSNASKYLVFLYNLFMNNFDQYISQYICFLSSSMSIIFSHCILSSSLITVEQKKLSALEMIYFLSAIGGNWSLTVMESLRMLGLSYSSMLIPRDNRRGSPLDPPLDVENARWRSRPLIMTLVRSP
jgi:hypothetical protein